MAAGLSDGEFRRAGGFDHGSAFQTLRHLVDVDWSWRQDLLAIDVGETCVCGHSPGDLDLLDAPELAWPGDG